MDVSLTAKRSLSTFVLDEDVPERLGAPARLPIASLQGGESVTHSYKLTLPPSLPAGKYPIEVGMYLPSTGGRLPVALDGKPAGDRVVVSTLDVGP